MKNLKKLFSILLVLTLVLSLAACGEKEEETASMDLTEGTSEAADETKEEAQVETKEETTTEEATEETTEEVTEETAEASGVEATVRAAFANLPDHIYKIGQVDFLDKVVAGDDMVIIDIRSADAYAAGHVKGAISMPWGGTAISDNMKYIPQDKEVFIYCVSGQTAGQTVLLMNAAGINARSVNLGYKFGIATTEGYEDIITETTENPMGTTEYPIEADMQAALDAYYAGLADVSGTTFANYKVSEDDLLAMIEGNEDFYLLSIRAADAYAEGHIEGAVNVPYGAGMLENLGSVPMDKKVVVYCYSGQTAGQATAAMRMLGYDAVSLNGGMGVGANAPIGWTNKEFPVISESAVETGAAAYFAGMPDHIYKIGQQDFVDKVVAGDDMVIIDIRSAAAYEESHVKGAISLPWGGTAISDNLKYIPQDKEVFIYCVSGQTAGQTVMAMNLAGINARSVNLGFKFGISTVEGVDAVLETEANAIGTTEYAIDPEIQAALDAYYAGLADVSGTTYANYKISEEGLEAKMANGEDFYLLSIRGADAYAEGHIEGAVNIPWGSDMLANIVETVPMDKDIVVYCYSGQTAGQAVAAMRLLGYNAVSLNGGMGVGANAPIGWTNYGGTVVQ